MRMRAWEELAVSDKIDLVMWSVLLCSAIVMLFLTISTAATIAAVFFIVYDTWSIVDILWGITK